MRTLDTTTKVTTTTSPITLQPKLHRKEFQEGLIQYNYHKPRTTDMDSLSLPIPNKHIDGQDNNTTVSTRTGTTQVTVCIFILASVYDIVGIDCYAIFLHRLVYPTPCRTCPQLFQRGHYLSYFTVTDISTSLFFLPLSAYTTSGATLSTD